MADRYWAGGTATWDGTAGSKWSATDGGATGASAPTIADDVYFTAAAGAVNVTLASGAVARSINCTGFTGTITHPAAFALSIGDATAGAGNIALKLVAGMTYTLGNVATSAITFASTAAGQQTIDFGGKAHGNLTFSAAGNYALISAMTQDETATVTHTSGTLQYDGVANNSGLSHSIGSLSSAGGTTRSDIFGTCTITARRSASSNHFAFSGSNNTFSAANATFVGTPVASVRRAYNYVFPLNSVVGTLLLNGDGEQCINENCTIGTLTRTGTARPFNILGIGFGKTVTVTNSLTVTGLPDGQRCGIWPTSTAIPGTFVVTGATVSLSHTDIQDIYFNNGGSNLNFSGRPGGIGDGGNNLMVGGGSIIFDPSTVQTWQGGAGNWSDPAKWTSRVPLAHDDVVFTGAFSGNPVIAVDRKWACRNLDTTGSTGAFTLRNDIYESYINGNMKFRNGVTWAVSSQCQWCSAPRSNITVTAGGMSPFSAQHSPSWQIGEGVTTTIGDDFGFGGSLNHRCGEIVVPSGVNFLIEFYFSNANNLTRKCKLTLNGGIVQLRSGSGNIFSLTNGASFFEYSATNDGHIRLPQTGAGTRTIAMSGASIPEVRIVGNGSGVTAFTGGGTLPKMPRVYTPGTANITFESGTTTTISSSGTEGLDNGANVISLKSSVGGSPATISKAAGTVNADYLSIQDITAQGGASFYAGANSTNVSGNTGWIFSAPPVAQTWVTQFMATGAP